MGLGLGLGLGGRGRLDPHAVVRLQLQVRDTYRAKRDGAAIDEALLQRRIRTWFVLGWPAFIGLVIVFWLMVAKPS